MADTDTDGMESSSRTFSRPTLAQIIALTSYMEKHPDIACQKPKLTGISSKQKKFWMEIANILNDIEGSEKSMQGWMEFWCRKKRFVERRQQQIEEAKLKSELTHLEQRILKLCKKNNGKRRKSVKEEPCNGVGDDIFDASDEVFLKRERPYESHNSRMVPTQTEMKQLNMFEKMVDVMGQQAAALTEVAQASLANSKALQSIAEASHIQAIAVDRFVSTFDNISSSTHDIRNAILGIDYTLKRCYPTQQRQNSTLFS